jgi:hypothetical protein
MRLRRQYRYIQVDITLRTRNLHRRIRAGSIEDPEVIGRNSSALGLDYGEDSSQRLPAVRALPIGSGMRPEAH